ncbi:unnamed protein product [Owenia fusiformis]|uniref:Uncharacterized protein n=1 Tax=Owenia fusiformis TaxID=6347 RepID=A0A8J1Y292_OWEFU|nr:unnamed protein product [Owenia fusiformis]
MRVMLQCVLTITCMTSLSDTTELLEHMFRRVRDEKFIPDGKVGIGHLKNIVINTPLDCAVECLKTSTCARINVGKLTETEWSCDLFGWGTGTKTTSPNDQHWTIINECEGGFLTNIYEGSSYCIIEEQLEWKDAEMKCIEYDAHLVAIETSNEQTSLVNYLENNSGPASSGAKSKDPAEIMRRPR